MNNMLIYIVPVLGIVALIVMAIKSAWVSKQDAGDEKMQGIAKSIQEGAMAFLKAEYRILLIFVVLASVALFAVSMFVETTSWMIVSSLYIWCFLFCFGRKYRHENSH
jgi:K(+)-stimulated pyrophosphate-energized sodium pump